jgi:nucleoside-diphosphate-sugar epimerase
MRSRSVSITGATGFIGSRLAARFRDDGWDVRAIVRAGNTRPVPAGVRVVEAPLDPVALASAFEGTDVVVHGAALIRGPAEAVLHQVNVEGTRAAVAAANAVAARLVHISSQAAAGPGTPVRPAREDDPPRPINAYGRTKLASEQIVRTLARVPWTIVRPCAVYGPGDRGFLPLFRLARRGLFFYIAPQTMHFTLIYIDDVVEAIVRSTTADSAVGQTFFVGHPESKTTEDVLRTIAHETDRPYRPRRLAPILLDAAALVGQLSWRIGRPPMLDRSRLAEFRSEGFVCSVDRARDVLGFRASISLEEGIRRTVRALGARTR